MFKLLLLVNLFVNPEIPHAGPPLGGQVQVQDASEPEQYSSSASTCNTTDYLNCISGCVDREPTNWRTREATCTYSTMPIPYRILVNCDCYYEWVPPINPGRPGLVTLGW